MVPAYEAYDAWTIEQLDEKFRQTDANCDTLLEQLTRAYGTPDHHAAKERLAQEEGRRYNLVMALERRGEYV